MCASNPPSKALRVQPSRTSACSLRGIIGICHRIKAQSHKLTYVDNQKAISMAATINKYLSKRNIAQIVRNTTTRNSPNQSPTLWKPTVAHVGDQRSGVDDKISLSDCEIGDTAKKTENGELAMAAAREAATLSE
ncbi:hypothetical protein L484_026531 [Morus notabilis]|uniref:Uncharacterized protein n=1 Tax=Morus notabilis TaxID=981085 RepID=W9QWI1_9ROSA|nr:hypothetical protein L484_026531 [Morus notabilis]